MMRVLALITALGLGTASAALAQAQVPSGLLAVAGKTDGLATAKGADQIEAVMAGCLTLGANPEVVQMVLTEAGWTIAEEFSDEYIRIFRPAADQDDTYAQLEPEAQTCAIGSTKLGVAQAHDLVLGLLGSFGQPFNTVTEGEGSESCTKYDLAAPMGFAGRIYVSVFDTSGDEPGCANVSDNSLTTFAFVPN